MRLHANSANALLFDIGWTLDILETCIFLSFVAETFSWEISKYSLKSCSITFEKRMPFSRCLFNWKLHSSLKLFWERNSSLQHTMPLKVLQHYEWPSSHTSRLVNTLKLCSIIPMFDGTWRVKAVFLHCFLVGHMRHGFHPA